MNKRGLSDIVSTVLIIMLVLAAVAIIGNIVIKNLNKSEQKIQEAMECQSLELDALKCTEGTNGKYTVQYKWVKGGDVKLEGVKVFVYDDTGQNVVVEDNAPPGFLGVKQRIGIIVTTLKGDISHATVAGVIKNEAGQEVVCDESPVKAVCPASTYVPPAGSSSGAP